MPLFSIRNSCRRSSCRRRFEVNQWFSISIASIGSNLQRYQYSLTMFSSWWFQIFVIFTPTWGIGPIWRAYFSNGWLNHQLVFSRFFFFQTDHQLGTSLDGPIHFPHGSRKPMSYWSGGPRQLPSLPPPEGLRRKMIQGLTDFFLEDGNGGIYGWCIYSCCILLVGGGLDKFCYFHPLLTWWNSETISFWFPPTTGHLQDDANF